MIQINPSDVITEAQNIYNSGVELEEDFVNIHQNIIDLHSTWKGKQYKEFADAYKAFLPQIVAMIKVTKVAIPQELQRKASNFYALDGQDVPVTRTPDDVHSFEEIEVEVGETISIDEQTVYGIKDQLSSKIDATIEKMNEIEAKVAEITSSMWQSENADEFKNEVSNLKNEIGTKLDELKTGIVSWINETVDDIKKADQM